MGAKHPRDRYVTLYGRKPVLEALDDDALEVARVFIADNARGDIIRRLLSAAKGRGVEVERGSASHISRISRNAKHDQGVAADVLNRRMSSVEEWLSEGEPTSAGGSQALLALDGVTTPANVGMILRTATALGIAGVVLPRRGCPEVGPLVIKASAGVALRAPILRCHRLSEGLELLREAGFALIGLDAAGADLSDGPLPGRAVYVLGNESRGMSEWVEARLDARRSIAMANGVESLNVAAAAAVLCYALSVRVGV